MSILENHLKNLGSKIDLSTPKKSTYNNTGETIPFTHHVTTDASHQEIFDHLKSMGYTKTKGYDPKPNTWSTTRDHDSMKTISSPVHHKDGIHARIEKEHGGKTKIHFEVKMANNLKEALLRYVVEENIVSFKEELISELKTRLFRTISNLKENTDSYIANHKKYFDIAEDENLRDLASAHYSAMKAHEAVKTAPYNKKQEFMDAALTKTKVAMEMNKPHSKILRDYN